MDESLQKSRIALTGASGFVGGALLRLLLSEGHAVLALGRRAPPETGASETGASETGTLTWQPCDLATTLPSATALAGCDAFAQIAAWAHRRAPRAAADIALLRRINVEAPLALLRAATEAGVKRFVFVSSSAVYGTARAGVLTEEADPRPQGLYGAMKLEAEQRLSEAAKASGISLCILRPPAVLGVGAPGSSRQLFRAAQLGLPLPAALLKNQRSFVAVEDLAAALHLALTHPLAAGLFNVADPLPASSGALLQEAARALGKSARLWPYPALPLRALLRLLGRGNVADTLFADLVLDSRLLQQRLGWSAKRPWAKVIGQAATAWRAR